MGKKVKVIQFIHGFTTGGAESLVKQYCQLFDKTKIDLLVIVLHNHNSIFDEELLGNHINVVYIDDIIDRKFSSHSDVIKKVMHRVYRKSLVKKIITDFEPDVIHYHLLLSNYLKYISLKDKTKIFLTVHSEPTALWSNKREQAIDKKAIEWLITHYNFKFIALHKKMLNEINELFEVENTIILNNGINFIRFTGNKSKQADRQKMAIPENLLVIGHIGRFMMEKNHKFIIEIFEQFKHNHTNAMLVLVGTGKLENEIKTIVSQKGLSQNVMFMGTRADIPEILKSLDVMLFPSLHEGMPITLIEAQAAGLPCLVSDNVTQEVVISNLIFFESLDASAKVWASKLDEIINMKIVPYVSNENWDLNTIVRKLETLYCDG